MSSISTWEVNFPIFQRELDCLFLSIYNNFDIKFPFRDPKLPDSP